MKTIAVTTFKGGVAKTTTAVNVAASLAHDGADVMGIDLDRTQRDFCSFEPDLGFEVRSTTAGRVAAVVERGAHDYLVIDCPPALSREPAAALLAADLAIVPVVPEMQAVRGLARFLEVVQAVRAPGGGNPNLQVIILLTMCDARDGESQQIEQQLRDTFGDTIWPTSIPRLVSINSANNALASVFSHAPRTNGAKFYRELARDIAARIPDHETQTV